MNDRLHHALEHAAHYLPAQAPLEVFVHHNTLHAFQHLPFHEALAQASQKLDASGYLPEAAYRSAYESGRIAGRDLDAAIAHFAEPILPAMPPGLPPSKAIAKAVLVHGIRNETPAGLAWRIAEQGATTTFMDGVSREAQTRIAGTLGALWEACQVPTESMPTATRAWFPRDAVLEVGGDDPHDLVDPVLILLAGAFLDRGQSHWSMPDREDGFFAAFCRVLGSGHAMRPSWLGSLGKRLRRWRDEATSAEKATGELLAELGIGGDELDAFVERTLFQLPGWAGMFHRLEAAPAVAGRSAARIRLVDFLAVRLTLDLLALVEMGRRLGHEGASTSLRAYLAKLPLLDVEHPGSHAHDRAWPLFVVAQHCGLIASEVRSATAELLELLARLDRPVRLRVWQEAYEAHYRDDLLRAIEAHRGDPRNQTAPRFELVACIDDRSEGLRRHFEEISPDHTTFGAAGFFNLAIAYQGIDDPTTFPLCPVIVTPKHQIREEPISEHAELAARRQSRRKTIGAMTSGLDRASRSVVWGPLVTALTGFVSALPLLAAVFAPFVAGRIRRRVSAWLLPAPKTRLTLPRTESDQDFSGFTIEEKAARVGALLEDIGLTKDFARIVVICGHDSTSVNNPHFAAYSCGACGGRSGGPNARLFARMANRAPVRALLRERGIDIPDTTLFIGAVHDTCADRFVLMDTDDVPMSSADRLESDETRRIALMPEIAALQGALDEAARRHAHERCRRFASAKPDASPSEAWRHVEGRSYDLSQPRPELGHASNAACIVGRRALTRGLFLDRRAFLASYDPMADPDGAILERVLLAVGPVGAGINLEYLFSTSDNERLGAGTKLPHNVTGLFGVMNGASSDLRTGLPKQMIEIHEPMRLQLVVETTPAVITAILERRPELDELVRNEWLRLSVVEPDGAATWIYRPGELVPWSSPESDVPIVARSRDWYAGHAAPLGPARIAQGAHDAA